MGRRPGGCSICAHPRADAINADLFDGRSGQSVATRFGLVLRTAQLHRSRCLGLRGPARCPSGPGAACVLCQAQRERAPLIEALLMTEDITDVACWTGLPKATLRSHARHHARIPLAVARLCAVCEHPERGLLEACATVVVHRPALCVAFGISPSALDRHVALHGDLESDAVAAVARLAAVQAWLAAGTDD